MTELAKQHCADSLWKLSVRILLARILHFPSLKSAPLTITTLTFLHFTLA